MEHSAAIYFGIVLMLGLAMGGSGAPREGCFWSPRMSGERDVRAQLIRPAFSSIGHLNLRYVPCSELCKNREAIALFGTGMKAIHSLSRALA